MAAARVASALFGSVGRRPGPRALLRLASLCPYRGPLGPRILRWFRRGVRPSVRSLRAACPPRPRDRLRSPLITSFPPLRRPAPPASALALCSPRSLRPAPPPCRSAAFAVRSRVASARLAPPAELRLRSFGRSGSVRPAWPAGARKGGLRGCGAAPLRSCSPPFPSFRRPSAAVAWPSPAVLAGPWGASRPGPGPSFRCRSRSTRRGDHGRSRRAARGEAAPPGHSPGPCPRERRTNLRIRSDSFAARSVSTCPSVALSLFLPKPWGKGKKRESYRLSIRTTRDAQNEATTTTGTGPTHESQPIVVTAMLVICGHDAVAISLRCISDVFSWLIIRFDGTFHLRPGYWTDLR